MLWQRSQSVSICHIRVRPPRLRHLMWCTCRRRVEPQLRHRFLSRLRTRRRFAGGVPMSCSRSWSCSQAAAYSPSHRAHASRFRSITSGSVEHESGSTFSPSSTINGWSPSSGAGEEMWIVYFERGS